MRITGGILSGRRLRVTGAKVRPTQDRVREAVFSSIAEHVPGARVLDLYAGAGSLGLEAWSRGAAEVCWVEKDARVCSSLKQAVSDLCQEPARPARVICRDAFRFLVSEKRRASGYELILADPPYARDNDESPLPGLLESIGVAGSLAAGGLLVFEQRANLKPIEADGWQLQKNRRYGDARILIYQRSST